MSRSLKTAVVVANEPIPSVSKNAVTNPRTACSGVGISNPPRAIATPYTTSAAARPTKRRLLASMHEVVGVGLRQIDARVPHLVHRLREQSVDRFGAAGVHHAVGREHQHRVADRLDI